MLVFHNSHSSDGKPADFTVAGSCKTCEICAPLTTLVSLSIQPSNHHPAIKINAKIT